MPPQYFCRLKKKILIRLPTDATGNLGWTGFAHVFETGRDEKQLILYRSFLLTLKEQGVLSTMSLRCRKHVSFSFLAKHSPRV